MKQSKKESLIEVVTSTLIGMLVSIITQMIVFPIYGMEVNLFQNFQITVIFTVVSIIRSYFVRRVFNK
jgi:hypothetical protein